MGFVERPLIIWLLLVMGRRHHLFPIFHLALTPLGVAVCAGAPVGKILAPAQLLVPFLRALVILNPLYWGSGGRISPVTGR